MGSAPNATPSTMEANDTTLADDVFTSLLFMITPGQRQDIASSAANARPAQWLNGATAETAAKSMPGFPPRASTNWLSWDQMFWMAGGGASGMFASRHV